jgi:NADH:ubiquinone oxidoreductase subunit K
MKRGSTLNIFTYFLDEWSRALSALLFIFSVFGFLKGFCFLYFYTVFCLVVASAMTNIIVETESKKVQASVFTLFARNSNALTTEFKKMKYYIV